MYIYIHIYNIQIFGLHLEDMLWMGDERFAEGAAELERQKWGQINRQLNSHMYLKRCFELTDILGVTFTHIDGVYVHILYK